MRLGIREFRIPIVLTALMLAVITYWTWQTWHRLDGPNMGKAQREAVKASDLLTSALCALDQSGQLSRNEMEHVFGTILRASSYQFLILIQEGQRVLQIGEIPAGLPPSFENGAFFIDTTFLFSRRAGLIPKLSGSTAEEPLR